MCSQRPETITCRRVCGIPSPPASVRRFFPHNWFLADMCRCTSYVIVVLTNQGSISLKNDPKTVKSDQRRLASFKTKVESVLSHLDFPVLLFAATARDQYRKPRTQMWHEVLDEFDLDANHGLDRTACFFVGDAGGRPAKSNARADHSCSDRSE